MDVDVKWNDSGSDVDSSDSGSSTSEQGSETQMGIMKRRLGETEIFEAKQPALEGTDRRSGGRDRRSEKN